MVRKEWYFFYTRKMFAQCKPVYPSGTFEEIFSTMIFAPRFEYDVEEFGVSSGSLRVVCQKRSTSVIRHPEDNNFSSA